MLKEVGNMKNNRGQALVEMALVIPILILLVFGMMDFGRVFNAYLVTSEASREGARAAVLNKTDGEITSAVTNAGATINLVSSDVNITPAYPRSRGVPVTVTVTKDIVILTPKLSQFVNTSYTVTSKTVMRME